MLRFNDGVTIDTNGEYRVLRLKDGYYVVGHGMSIPCSDRDEAYRELKDLQTAKRFKSCAEWEAKHGFAANMTTDTHSTREAAEAVCRGLQREGLGGERVHFPIRTWVEPV